MKHVRSNLKQMADSRGIKIRQLARDIDYRYETVRQMYNDDLKQFPRDLLDKLCDYFDCDINELLILVEE
ncbi:helix-turn-helix transcriptional regulator [Paenibacillus alvei]|uniref:Helix-turn-helix transcriptional regulator n=1 Tax=Paenibacillus alvei TaxID=44250 RepID=A0ABT4H8M7_PAEAL|nr:helix-turn-helix transcriptional regulator [Paenibacillus alvei]EJW14270.1 hypothetical protein PAV_15c00590 [Paenibacillus alvei DSM 29]MCY9539246.1 helix-turn-helix transcriptional regulator [Paenibacillus alvei]MCY9708713.1 helix-turn-helix transcriptional regulator [Paenibacillus alvei]MCY9738262.1 helix-turn-helix transcriptional regulator [Paenibacillus alvei]MCY9758537.1 helix-turn-helix transcriptional regulator [Paenibacillus alvei]